MGSQCLPLSGNFGGPWLAQQSSQDAISAWYSRHLGIVGLISYFKILLVVSEGFLRNWMVDIVQYILWSISHGIRPSSYTYLADLIEITLASPVRFLIYSISEEVLKIKWNSHEVWKSTDAILSGLGLRFTLYRQPSLHQLTSSLARLVAYYLSYSVKGTNHTNLTNILAWSSKWKYHHNWIAVWTSSVLTSLLSRLLSSLVILVMEWGNCAINVLIYLP